ncbi:MAG TPA: hypothetical protein VD790_11690 [Thermoleophilaceae bacterium]|nr:hypothetical protein [Thermoleophilaceae bacterium]
MSAPGLAGLLRRAGEWLVEPADRAPLNAPPELAVVPTPRFPLVGVVGLARRCGTTTLARALAAELALRRDGAAVVASPSRPAIVPLGSTRQAGQLADSLALDERRAAGRLCLAACADAARLASATRGVAPAVMEVEPGTAALDAAPALDRVVLVASPDLEPALAAAVAQTIAAVAEPPVVAVNRAPDHGPWLVHGDVLVPDSRVGARLALAGREPRGWLGRAIGQLADLCDAV